MKTILGLDLGTNSIGWAKVTVDDNENYLRDTLIPQYFFL